MEENLSHEINQAELDDIGGSVENLKAEIAKVIIGQDDAIEMLLVTIFVGGHVLLEGPPGIAKTLLAKMVSQTLSVDFSRIQFTPDLMPTDVLGTTVLNMKTSDFNFKKGPIFSNIILIDEINRAPAKTQAALFEVMEEFQITYDGITYPMAQPFFVMATQNPIEQEGTYKLPEAQLDRFIFKIKITYPNLEEEIQILQRYKSDFKQQVKKSVQAIFSPDDIQKCRTLVERVFISDELIKYIAQIVDNTRNNGDIYLGASPRASLAILKSSKAFAMIKGRGFVTPEDIQTVCLPILNHRIILSPEREMEGIETEDIIKEILQNLEVPR